MTCALLFYPAPQRYFDTVSSPPVLGIALKALPLAAAAAGAAACGLEKLYPRAWPLTGQHEIVEAPKITFLCVWLRPLLAASVALAQGLKARNCRGVQRLCIKNQPAERPAL